MRLILVVSLLVLTAAANCYAMPQASPDADKDGDKQVVQMTQFASRLPNLWRGYTPITDYQNSTPTGCSQKSARST